VESGRTIPTDLQEEKKAVIRKRVLSTLGQPSIMREETFASAVDVGYGCGNPNINHD
jgi:hypothetical protein